MPVQIQVKKPTIQIGTKNPTIQLKKGSSIPYEDFLGDYEYNPLLTTQIIECYNKHMLDNVVFNMIQTRETQLESGGVQFDILG